MRRALLLCALAAAAACVPYPGEQPLQEIPSTIVTGPFRPLDAGAYHQESLHFEIHAYGRETAQRVVELAEANYNRIMVDTGLYSFKPRGLYQIVIYGSKEEYSRKTSQPEWSGGATVGNAIYSYLGPRLPGTLAHEMTHLVFFEYMGRLVSEHRWINEGLAEFEEAAAEGAAIPNPFTVLQGASRREPVSMEHMTLLVPATEKERSVNDWYAQARAMIRFMIERGGRIGFSHFLAALREQKTVNQAMAEGFPGVWRDLGEFERSWRSSLL